MQNKRESKETVGLKKQVAQLTAQLEQSHIETTDAIDKGLHFCRGAEKYNAIAAEAVRRNGALSDRAQRAGDILIARRGELLAEILRIETLIDELGYVKLPLYDGQGATVSPRS